MPTSSITISVITFCTTSAAVRPKSTAEREIGSERKRSITPAARSVLRPMPVISAPKTAVWTMIPGIRKSTYAVSPVLIAPPKT